MRMTTNAIPYIQPDRLPGQMAFFLAFNLDRFCVNAAAQSRPYVLLSLLCFFGGVLIAALSSYLYYRRFVGVTPTDRMGHTRFVDETPAGAFKI